MSNSVSITNRLDDRHQLTDSPLIRSSNRKYFAVMQLDGNFVLYKDLEDKKIRVWSSGTSGKGTGPYHVELENGNLVLYGNSCTKLFSTKIEKTGESPHHLIVENDGRLVIYDAKDNPIWSSDTSNTLPAGGVLQDGDQIVSPSGNYAATMSDGSLIITKQDSTCVWSSCTGYGSGNIDNYLEMAASGNLLIYQKLSAGPKTILSWVPPSGTGSYTPFSLVINDDGSLNVYGNSGTTIIYKVYDPAILATCSGLCSGK